MSTAAQITGAVPGPLPLTPEWHTERARYVTASRVPAILGCSEYDTPYGVYMEMTGERPPFEGNEHTRRGNRYEGAILGDYAEQRGCELIYPMPLHYDVSGVLAATPDAQVVGLPEGVEAKCTMSRTRACELGEEGTDQAPQDWILQATAQMAVMGWQRVDLAVLLYGRLRVYPILRDEELVAIIRSAAEEFAARVRDRRPPEPTWTHPRTLDLVKSLHGVQEESRVDLSDDTEVAWQKYVDLGETIRTMEAERKEQQAKVLHAMGAAGLGVLPSGRMLQRKEVFCKAYEVAEKSYVRLSESKPRKTKR